MDDSNEGENHDMPGVVPDDDTDCCAEHLRELGTAEERIGSRGMVGGAAQDSAGMEQGGAAMRGKEEHNKSEEASRGEREKLACNREGRREEVESQGGDEKSKRREEEGRHSQSGEVRVRHRGAREVRRHRRA